MFDFIISLSAVLLNTFWREGKIDEAILAVEDMERRGIVGTAGLYYDLARCLCSADRCQEALMQVGLFVLLHFGILIVLLHYAEGLEHYFIHAWDAAT